MWWKEKIRLLSWECWNIQVYLVEMCKNTIPRCFIVYGGFKLSCNSRAIMHFLITNIHVVRLITIWTYIAVCRLFQSFCDRGPAFHRRAVVSSTGCNRGWLVRSRDHCMVTYDAHTYTGYYLWLRNFYLLTFLSKNWNAVCTQYTKYTTVILC